MGIDPAEIEKAIAKQLKGKKKAIDLNVSAVKLGLEYAAANFPSKIPHRVERMDATTGQDHRRGQRGGRPRLPLRAARRSAPGTRSRRPRRLCESFIDFCDELRVDPATGKKNVAIIQAEDEIASIGMVLGAGWAGARAFTATSGPGISLMSEFIGLGYYTEIPAVIFDVQRVGPSTGLPTRTMQGDLLLCYYNSHGDAKHPVLFPASPEECFTMAGEAFDLAEQLQTPVFVLSDLDLGMNNWMSDPFPYPTAPLDRGKVLDAAAIEKVKDTWGRYKDVDGDAIPYRTLPGTNSPGRRVLHARLGPQRDGAVLREGRPTTWTTSTGSRGSSTRRGRSSRSPRSRTVPAPPPALLAFGTSHYGRVRGAATGWPPTSASPLDYCRLRALPVGAETAAWIRRHERIYVVEQNRDSPARDDPPRRVPRPRDALRPDPPVQRPPPRRDDRRRRRPLGPRESGKKG